MKNMEVKKALLLLDKKDTARSLAVAEEFFEKGYDLYAQGDMVLFFNQHMIPVSYSPEASPASFDCVIQ